MAVWACAAAVVQAKGTTAQLHQCIANLASGLPSNVAAILWRIEDTDRQLLALRSYLRNGPTLAARWSWSAAQIASYERSAEYRAVQNELAKIAARFAALNPGYTLYVNSQVRSLDTQVSRWNENASVGAAARVLQKAAKRRLTRSSCTQSAGRADDAFGQFLKSWQPPRSPTLAAPGLSKHGQARAFDFQIKRGDRIVAGTDTSQSVAAWDKKGWTRKLRRAVSSASGKFSGPLQMPYEPWHYEYNP